MELIASILHDFSGYISQLLTRRLHLHRVISCPVESAHYVFWVCDDPWFKEVTMALRVCKNCKGIVPLNTDICLYCQESTSVKFQPKFKPRRIGIRGVSLFLGCLIFAMLIKSCWHATDVGIVDISTVTTAKAPDRTSSEQKISCLSSPCLVGSKAFTSVTLSNFFYTCKSKELSEYANFVLGVMDSQVGASGIRPSITKFSGEPEVQGNEKLLMDKFREKAGVHTFEEAISKCYRGRDDMNVMVQFSPIDSTSIYVTPEDVRQSAFWMPKASLFHF